MRIRLLFILCFSGFYVVAMEPENQLIASQLIAQVAKARPYGFTQSQAQLSVQKIQQKLLQEEGLVENRRIIDRVFERERQYKDGYYVFYTAVPRMHLLQDVTRKLYKLVVGNEGTLKEKAFQFIRYLYKDHNKFNLSNNHEVRFEVAKMIKYPDIKQLLEDEMRKHGIIDDHLPLLKGILISANCALFGNIGSTGESTWNFFVNTQPWAWKQEKLEKRLYLILSSFGIPSADQKQFINELIALNEAVAPVNDLFQIFIPKKKVDRIGYASWRLGLLFDTVFINKLLENVKNQTPLDQLKYKNIRDAVTAFREKWQRDRNLPYNSPNRDWGIIDTVNALLQKVRNGNFALSLMLEKYINDPENLQDINTRQARLLAGLLVDPMSDIRIYRYYNMDNKKRTSYRTKLNKVFKKIEKYLQADPAVIRKARNIM